MDAGFEVFLYLPEKLTSIYISLVKNHKIQVVRFSDHLPKLESWLNVDVDYYVGPKELGMFEVKEILDAIYLYFR